MRCCLLLALLATACSKSPSPAPAAETKPTAAPAHLGTPIAANVPVVALAAIVKDPAAYKGTSFVTTGTVTAVCQAMGCWMEIADDHSEAHIKMAGESFFVPKTSAGHKARVQGTLADVTGDDVECAKEATQPGQPGRRVAKLQVEATGVELD